MTCDWCGDTHGSTSLCQRAQREMTRRSFCFLFGVGIAGLTVTPSLPQVGKLQMTFVGQILLLNGELADLYLPTERAIAYAAQFRARDAERQLNADDSDRLPSLTMNA